MIKFWRNANLYLVTGSDRQKTVDQLGLDICYRTKRVYNCSGAMCGRRMKIYRSSWGLIQMLGFLQDELDYSQFPVRCGLHIEERPGGVNFSFWRGGGVNLLREKSI